MIGSVVMEVSEDQNREKAGALAARLIRTLDSSKVHMEYGSMGEQDRYLGHQGGNQEHLGEGERLQRGGRPTGRDPPRSKRPWVRVDTRPTGAVRKLAQTGKVAIGWSIAKVETIERRPLQCFSCLEIGHIGKTCAS